MSVSHVSKSHGTAELGFEPRPLLADSVVVITLLLWKRPPSQGTGKTTLHKEASSLIIFPSLTQRHAT